MSSHLVILLSLLSFRYRSVANVYITFIFSCDNNIIQEFPGDLLEPNYPEPNNPRQLLARSEVDRRGNYFERLERKLQESAGYPLVGVVKQCLENVPEERPTVEQLVTVLEGMRGDIEGGYGELATVDAVRQVRTMKALKSRSDDKINELTAKDEEIQQLRQQLEVNIAQVLLWHHRTFG